MWLDVHFEDLSPYVAALAPYTYCGEPSRIDNLYARGWKDVTCRLCRKQRALRLRELQRDLESEDKIKRRAAHAEMSLLQVE